MTIHMTAAGLGTFCGVRGAALTLTQLVRFHPVTYWAMKLFGCRSCGAELRDALRMARRIV